jgi:hypothetical protein
MGLHAMFSIYVVVGLRAMFFAGFETSLCRGDAVEILS